MEAVASAGAASVPEETLAPACTITAESGTLNAVAAPDPTISLGAVPATATAAAAFVADPATGTGTGTAAAAAAAATVGLTAPSAGPSGPGGPRSPGPADSAAFVHAGLTPQIQTEDNGQPAGAAGMSGEGAGEAGVAHGTDTSPMRARSRSPVPYEGFTRAGAWTEGEKQRMLDATGHVEPANRTMNKFPKGFMEDVAAAVGTRTLVQTRSAIAQHFRKLQQHQWEAERSADAKEPRRSGRDAKKRFVSVGRHTVLKENMYTLDEGIKTISGSGINKALASLPRVVGPRSAFIFFSMEVKQANAVAGPAGPAGAGLVGAMKQAGTQWGLLPAEDRLTYTRMAEQDRARFETETAARYVQETQLLKDEQERLAADAERESAERKQVAEKRQLDEEAQRLRNAQKKLKQGDAGAGPAGAAAPDCAPPAGLYDPTRRSGTAARPVRLISAKDPALSYVFESGNAAASYLGVAGSTVSLAKRTGAMLKGGWFVSTGSDAASYPPITGDHSKHGPVHSPTPYRPAGVASFKPTPRQTAHSEKQAHNRKVQTDFSQALQRRNTYFKENIDVIKPFVSQKAVDAISRAAAVEATAPTVLAEQPPDLVTATLRDYQVRGLEFLVTMHDRGCSCILADEMGLGKTLQTIAFLSYLKHKRKLDGPSLVICPLSVLSSWKKEFKSWCPQMRVVQLHSADMQERERLKKQVINDIKTFDVVITTYEMAKSPNMRHALSTGIWWRYVILDEGHKIKNEMSDISTHVAKIHSQGRLLLTGTPLQNNLHELWALLRYLHPDTFDDSSSFDTAFDLTKSLCDEAKLGEAHKLLRVFQLRRVKSEVEARLPDRHEMKIVVPLSEDQKFWVEQLLSRDAEILAAAAQQVQGGVPAMSATTGEDNLWKRLNNLLMQLRKVCNHPFQMPGAEPQWDGKWTDESIVQASGKMQVLDKLLPQLKAAGNRVVLFSQFQSMLDIMEDYLLMRGYEYVRLDGSTCRVQRTLDLRVFNAKNSRVFIYIMSTRAGGLGINAQTADSVILQVSLSLSLPPLSLPFPVPTPPAPLCQRAGVCGTRSLAALEPTDLPHTHTHTRAREVSLETRVRALASRVWCVAPSATLLLPLCRSLTPCAAHPPPTPSTTATPPPSLCRRRLAGMTATGTRSRTCRRWRACTALGRPRRSTSTVSWPGAPWRSASWSAPRRSCTWTKWSTGTRRSRRWRWRSCPRRRSSRC